MRDATYVITNRNDSETVELDQTDVSRMLNALTTLACDCSMYAAQSKVERERDGFDQSAKGYRATAMKLEKI